MGWSTAVVCRRTDRTVSEWDAVRLRGKVHFKTRRSDFFHCFYSYSFYYPPPFYIFQHCSVLLFMNTFPFVCFLFASLWDAFAFHCICIVCAMKTEWWIDQLIEFKQLNSMFCMFQRMLTWAFRYRQKKTEISYKYS